MTSQKKFFLPDRPIRTEIVKSPDDVIRIIPNRSFCPLTAVRSTNFSHVSCESRKMSEPMFIRVEPGRSRTGSEPTRRSRSAFSIQLVPHQGANQRSAKQTLLFACKGQRLIFTFTSIISVPGVKVHQTRRRKCEQHVNMVTG